RLADRFRHFACLARTVADPALAVADHHQRRETETPSALHHFGDAVDRNQLFDELGLFAVAPLPVAAFAATPPARPLRSIACRSSHQIPRLRMRARLRGPRRPGLSPARGTDIRRDRTPLR